MTLSKIRLVITTSVLALFLTACGGDDDVPVAPPADPGPPPSVLYSSRSDGAADAAVNTDIVAVMSKALDPASVTNMSLMVTDDGNQPVAGTVEYDASRFALIFHQASDLSGGHKYTATVAETVRSSTGVPMASSYSWSFTVDGSRHDTDAQRTIQQILDKAAYTYQIPGSIIAIRDDHGNTWATTNGYADRLLKTPMTTDMSFRVGGNTETYVATEVLKLVDAGTIGLDDPINNYLSTELATDMPHYAVTQPYINQQITIRYLLQHTAGFINFTVDQTWGQAFTGDPYAHYTPDELLQIADKHWNDPGAPSFNAFSYSNTDYVLLGMLIKNVTGVRYEDSVAANITFPQGLANTRVPESGDLTIPTPYSHGYYQDSKTGQLYDMTVRDPSTLWSSGNMLSTIADLAKWDELLGKGTLLTPATQTERLQFVSMDDHLKYGLGIIKDTNANMIGDQGNTIGYTLQTYYVPDYGYSLAFFYNRTLALPYVSNVMTYDTINALWPTRTAAEIVLVKP